MHRLTATGLLALAGLGFSDAHAALQTPIIGGGTATGVPARLSFGALLAARRRRCPRALTLS